MRGHLNAVPVRHCDLFEVQAEGDCVLARVVVHEARAVAGEGEALVEEKLRLARCMVGASSVCLLHMPCLYERQGGSAHSRVSTREGLERPEGEAHVHEDVEVPRPVRELVVRGGVLHEGNVLLHPNLQAC